MSQEQNESRGAVVHHGGGFPSAKQREIFLQVTRAPAALAARKIIFQVAIIPANARRRRGAVSEEWSAPEIGVDENARGVDHGLNTGRSKARDRGANPLENGLEGRDLVFSS